MLIHTLGTKHFSKNNSACDIEHTQQAYEDHLYRDQIVGPRCRKPYKVANNYPSYQTKKLPRVLRGVAMSKPLPAEHLFFDLFAELVIFLVLATGEKSLHRLCPRPTPSTERCLLPCLFGGLTFGQQSVQVDVHQPKGIQL